MGATINFKAHYKFTFFYTIASVAFVVLFQQLNGFVFMEVRLSTVSVTIALIISNLVYWTMMNQFWLLLYVFKTRFEALNLLFW